MNVIDIPRYQIIENEMGLMISESRTGVLDVMELYDQGLNIYQISTIFNLTPLQVQIAIEYIDQHREELEPKLKEALRYSAELEAFYNALAAEREKVIIQLPVTPQRMGFNALREKNQRAYQVH